MGKLYGIGVGPGDPELLTLKAYRLLGEADYLFCPEKEAGAGSVAFDIIKDLIAGKKAQIVNLTYPMHYHGQKLRELWKENAAVIAEYLAGEATGVFITLGDPAVYSTFMYTMPYLEELGVRTEVVPGVPSFCAAAGRAGVPLMTWNESLVVAPVRRNSGGELTELLKNHDNAVLMKPSADKAGLLDALKENGLEQSFVLVEKAGTGEERIITELTELEQEEIPYLSTMIIKKQGISL